MKYNKYSINEGIGVKRPPCFTLADFAKEKGTSLQALASASKKIMLPEPAFSSGGKNFYEKPKLNNWFAELEKSE